MASATPVTEDGGAIGLSSSSVSPSKVRKLSKSLTNNVLLLKRQGTAALMETKVDRTTVFVKIIQISAVDSTIELLVDMPKKYKKKKKEKSSLMWGWSVIFANPGREHFAHGEIATRTIDVSEKEQRDTIKYLPTTYIASEGM